LPPAAIGNDTLFIASRGVFERLPSNTRLDETGCMRASCS